MRKKFNCGFVLYQIVSGLMSGWYRSFDIKNHTVSGSFDIHCSSWLIPVHTDIVSDLIGQFRRRCISIENKNGMYNKLLKGIMYFGSTHSG